MLFLFMLLMRLPPSGLQAVHIYSLRAEGEAPTESRLSILKKLLLPGLAVGEANEKGKIDSFGRTPNL